MFILDTDTLPYGVPNELRWEKVVFERWASLSVKSPQFSEVNELNVEIIPVKNSQRNFEAEGIQGWEIYSYESDDNSPNRLVLHTRKTPKKIRLTWDYEQIDGNRLILNGANEQGVNFKALLVPIEKKYLIEEAFKSGRRSKLSL